MNLPVWRQYAASFKGSEAAVVLGGLLSLVTGLTLVPIPLLVGYAFDRIIPTGRIPALVALGAAILALHLVNGACALGTRLVILKVTKDATARLRRDAVAKLLTVSRAYYNAHDRPALHELVVLESERIDVMGNALLAELLPAVALSLGISVVLLVLQWKLFLLMLAILPLNVVAARQLGSRVRDAIQAFHRSFKTFSERVLVVLSAIDLIRVRAAEDQEAASQAAHIEALRRTSATMSVLGASYTVVQQTLIAVAGVAVLVAGGMEVAAGTMTLGSLLSYFAGLMLLRAPLNVMMASVPRVMEGVQSLAQFMPFLAHGDREPYSGRQRADFTGAVSLRDVSFSYGVRPVVEHVSLSIRPGETVALVGPNGSGKSTIVNLILGFYRPQSGAVFADETPYADIDIRKLRREIGVVMQDPIMVPGSIFDNLAYGVPGVCREEVVAASRLAGVDGFVSRLEDGYDSSVGEGGSLLSGGQRQRVALARALIGKPKLLILDEPMNHLDEVNGPAFLARLTAAASPPAILLISHRHDVISLAHRVYEIDGGQLVRVHAGGIFPPSRAFH